MPQLSSQVSVFSYVQPITQQYKLKNSIKVTTRKIQTISIVKGSHHQIETFAATQKKEGTGKPMKKALYILQYAKRHLSG